MTFKEFLHAWNNDLLDRDAAWRAYDINAAFLPRYVTKGLKDLKLSYAGELAVPQFMALYGVPTRAEAEAILSAWHLWSRIDAGRPCRVPLRTAKGG